LLEEMFGISHKHSTKTAIGGCTAKLGRWNISNCNKRFDCKNLQSRYL